MNWGNRQTIPDTFRDYPSDIDTPPRKALYDNLGDASSDSRRAGAIILDIAIQGVLTDNWKGSIFKERRVKSVIKRVIQEELDDLDLDIDEIFELVKSQDGY